MTVQPTGQHTTIDRLRADLPPKNLLDAYIATKNARLSDLNKLASWTFDFDLNPNRPLVRVLR
jgi:hypothetical protein